MKELWYNLVRLYSKLAVKLFFRRIEINGFDNFPLEGPVLLAPNHQNAFMDALIPTAFAPNAVHFLARSDIFKSAFGNWFFRSIKMMPIYRQRDGLANLAKNDETFEECFEILRKQGTLLIFPEASHLGERRLRPLSKGFARIVFGAMENHDDLDIKILPVGLNYSNYHASQSRMLLNFGEPLAVRDYVAGFKENQAKAMSAMRADLQERLEDAIVHIDRKDAERAFDIEMERLLPFHLRHTSGFSKAVDQHNFYKLREAQLMATPAQSSYFQRLAIYDQEMEKYKLRAPFFFIGQKDPGYWVIQNLLLIFFLPIFLLSWLVNAPIYFTVRAILKKYVSDLQFYSSIKLVGSILLFPIILLIYIALAAILSPRPLLAMGAVMVFLPLSVFIIRELRLPYRYTLTMWRMLRLKFRKKDLYLYLKRIESEVINLCPKRP